MRLVTAVGSSHHLTHRAHTRVLLLICTTESQLLLPLGVAATARYIFISMFIMFIGLETSGKLFPLGASTTDDILKIRLQLTKPVTWIPLIWGVLCGAAASGA